MLGFFLSLSLRYPRLAAFLLKHRKTIAKVLAVIALVSLALAAFFSWRGHLIKDAREEGRAAAEAQFALERAKADEKVRADQAALTELSSAYTKIAETRTGQIIRLTQPTIERVTREVYTDPRYRDCVVSDGVLGELNQGRTAVDQAAAATAPGGAR